MTVATFILIVLLCFAVLLLVLATGVNINLSKQLQEKLESDHKSLSADMAIVAKNQKVSADDVQQRFEALAEVLNLLHKQNENIMAAFSVTRKDLKEQAMQNLAILHAAVTKDHPDVSKN